MNATLNLRVPYDMELVSLDPFLTTFYYVEKRNGILRKNRGEGFKKSYIPLVGGWGGSKIAKITFT